MEEKNSCQTTGDEQSQSCCGGVAPLIVGIVASLLVGWWLFPKALFSQQQQPIRFSHKVHVEAQSMACQDCHSFSADGKFGGFPTTAKCAECHSDVLGEDPAERKFVEEYVRTNKEVPWLKYQYQPDNVYFSHMAHNKERCTECHADLYATEAKLCNQCHPAVSTMDTPPAHYENRLTGYSMTTMRMPTCEKCHAIPDHLNSTNASNACFVCHK